MNYKDFTPFKASENVFIEAHFEHANRDCIIIFSRAGYRCGYVSLKEKEAVMKDYTFGKRTHTGVDYDSYNVDCHGGLTFGEEMNKSYNPKQKYYVGFDCAHCYDGVDKFQVIEYGLKSDCISDMFINGAPMSLDECVSECEQIAEQLNNKED